MARDYNKVYIRTVEIDIAATGVAGDFLFDLSPHAARNNLLEYFYFVDGTGAQVDATAGSVVVTMSPGVALFQTINNGTFNAVDARLGTRTKPNGFGKANQIKITLAGILGAPVGFVGLVTQSVS